jgi:TetR/AcrR family acrAB operon transcriptional repressor
MARRTKEDAQATRSQILDAAERVFLRRGVGSASLQEIAQEAQLTRGAIYWHFENKADLFDAMMQRVTLPMVAHFNAVPVEQENQPLQHLRQSVGKVFHQTVHDQQVRRVLEIAAHQVEYGDSLQVVRERRVVERGGHVADIDRLLTLAVEKGELGKGVSTPVAAVGLHALVDGLITNWLLAPQAFDLEHDGVQVLDVYLAGLVGVK